MKTSLIVFLMLIITCSLTLVEMKKSLRNSEKEQTLEASKQEVQVKNVYAFSNGSDGGNRLRDSSTYKIPEIVDNIDTSVSHEYEKESGEAVEKESVKNYYNGELNLNRVRVICKGYNSPSSCYSISHCGWCGSSNSCIEGTRHGPVERCANKDTYTYENNFEGTEKLAKSK